MLTVSKYNVHMYSQLSFKKSIRVLGSVYAMSYDTRRRRVKCSKEYDIKIL